MIDSFSGEKKASRLAGKRIKIAFARVRSISKTNKGRIDVFIISSPRVDRVLAAQIQRASIDRYRPKC